MHTPYDTNLPPHLRALKEEIEGYARGYGLDFFLERAEVGGQVRVVRNTHGQRPVPRNSLIDPRMASRSGISLATTLSRLPSISWMYSKNSPLP